MHPEVLTSEGRETLAKISVPAGFYLAGGTGLALQLGHRISADFDFFNSQKIPEIFLADLEKQLAGPVLKIAVNNPDELTVRCGETKLTFLHYPFPVALPFLKFGKFDLAGILEIAAMKAHALCLSERH